MAARKKAKKKTSAAKAKRASARKSKSRKAGKAKAPAKKTMKALARKKQIVGEGDYAASNSFLKDQSGFVAKNRAKIPAMGKAAEKALEGPQGDSLREAEATAAARSRDIF
ncbi:MAG TPA: hypothetical protein VMO78_17840 [Rhizomicrobium sp.]|nr:hypothetical protein [Rhizomicrobium sp.]